MKDKLLSFFKIPEYYDQARPPEQKGYKALRITALACLAIGLAAIIPSLFAGEWTILVIYCTVMGLLCLAGSRLFLKKVITPEYREKCDAQLEANKAANAALKAVAKEIINPSYTSTEDLEDDSDYNSNEEASDYSTDYTYETATQTKGEEKMINKSVQALQAQLGAIGKHAAAALPDILESMNDDEVILYAFKSMMLERNPGRPGRDSVTNAVNILTNKRYYFAGTDGQSVVFAQQLKSGSVALRDVHATNSGTITLHGAYVGFETKNDDYKIWLGAGVKPGPVKGWLDEAIQKAQENDGRGATIQAALSPADELKKFKELLDMGVITQEEFDTKKKQLLGL